MSVNKATILGNVGNDPEIKTFDNGNKVANFSIATTENWKNKDGEKQSATEWHRISVFGKLADIVEQYVKKGQQLYIEGKIKTRSWGDDNDKKYVTEIVLNGFGDVLQMIGKKEESTYTPPANNVQEFRADPLVDEEDGLPF
jgi:single-strand DNA-binding protein